MAYQCVRGRAAGSWSVLPKHLQRKQSYQSTGLSFWNHCKRMLVQGYLCEHYRHSPDDDFHFYGCRWSRQFRMPRDQQARMGQCKHGLTFESDFKRVLVQGYLWEHSTHSPNDDFDLSCCSWSLKFRVQGAGASSTQVDVFLDSNWKRRAPQMGILSGSSHAQPQLSSSKSGRVQLGRLT